MSATKQVVIIGAGPGGLAAAMLLAGAGSRVKVLERRDRVGGRTSAIGGDGFRFDLGPTFFLYPRVLEAIFAASAATCGEEVELVRLDPQYHLIFGGGGELLATGRRRADGAGDRRRYRPHDAAIPAVPGRQPGEVGALPAGPGIAVPRLARPALAAPAQAPALLRPWLSLDRELRRYFRDPRVRLALTFQSKYLGMSPFKCPSLFSILSFLEYEYGVFHPIGGCGAVTESMAEIARELGVEIPLDDDGRGDPLRGPTGRRRAVAIRVSTSATPWSSTPTSPSAMTRLVPDHLRRRWTDRKIARKRFSCSTFMLYLGIEGQFDDLAHHTIYLAKDYRPQPRRDREAARALRRSVVLRAERLRDRSRPGAAGCSTLYVLLPVTHQHPNVDWDREAPRSARSPCDNSRSSASRTSSRESGSSGWSRPADWERRHEIHLGATFNLAHTLKQMLHLRPGNRFEDLESVYLVGGGTHPGSGLPVIFESARITSRLIGQDFGLPVAVDGPDRLPPGIEVPAPRWPS